MQTERINTAASGESIEGVVICWDDATDSPAYREGDICGLLEFTGWGGSVDGAEDDTYHISSYFGADGKYLGPDQHGVYPTFEVQD